MLTDNRRAALAAVCDTFIPGWNGSGEDANPALLDRAAGLIEQITDSEASSRLGMLLDTLGNGVANLLLGGPPHGITRLTHDQRVRLLRGWADSPLELKRAGFQALKRLVHFAHYAFPVDGVGHPAWRAVGFPGPLPHAPDEENRELPEVTVQRDTTLECDVVVVGSGAGGGVVAGVLAEAGKSVIVLEKGRQHLPRTMTHVEGEAFSSAYLGGGLLMTRNASMPILAGSGVGGGTVINYTTSFPLPGHTRAEWDRLSGLTLFGSPRFTESLDRVMARLSVGTEWSIPSARDAILDRGCRSLGYHVDAITRNVVGCPSQEACGYCGLGCRHNAKQTSAITYLADAARHGARLVTQCDVLRVLVDKKRAWGVVARVQQADGGTAMLTVKAKAVVAACGAVETPALLCRSGIHNRAIGRGLRLHPVTAVTAHFPERVEPWVGHLQTRYSEQFVDWSHGYGSRFETTAVAFALPASAYGWETPDNHRAHIRRLAHLGLVGILLRDRAPGRVVTGRDGTPRVEYDLSKWDTANLRIGLRGAAEVLAAAGAADLTSLHQPPVHTRPGERGWLDAFMAGMDSRGYGAGRMAFITFHQMASCAMGTDRRRSVVGETGESHDVKGLYVADGSAFVTSSGVNPMITIMAIADHVARAMAGR